MRWYERPRASKGENLEGWHSRGYLPHFEHEEVCKFVTFGLRDAFPAEAVKRMESQLLLMDPKEQKHHRRRAFERLLDAGHGECILRQPKIAEIVENSLLFFEGQRYRLEAWVVMPNHVHVLFETHPSYQVSSVLHSWKSFTAKEICKASGRSGRVWQQDYWDRYVRNAKHHHTCVQYIEHNPVAAGLEAKRED